jgi:hypothetical protein
VSFVVDERTMPDQPTLYDRLGLNPDATDGEISAAFRQAAWAVHPDRGQRPDEAPAREARTKELTEAYNVLSSSEARARYDRSLGWRAGGNPMTRLRRRTRGFLAARRWRPSAPKLARPGWLHLPGFLGTGFGLIVDTRLGQWSLVLAGVIVGALAGGPSLALLSGPAAGFAVALVLSGGGLPSPLWDAATLFWPLAGGSGRLVSTGAGRFVGTFGAILAERFEEARLADRKDIEQYTEASREALRKEAGRYGAPQTDILGNPIVPPMPSTPYLSRRYRPPRPRYDRRYLGPR